MQKVKAIGNAGLKTNTEGIKLVKKAHLLSKTVKLYTNYCIVWIILGTILTEIKITLLKKNK